MYFWLSVLVIDARVQSASITYFDFGGDLFRSSPRVKTRGCSSAGRAPDLHSGGRRFDPDQLHQFCSSLNWPDTQKITGYHLMNMGL